MAIMRLQGEQEKRAGIYYEFNTNDQPLGEGGTGKVFAGRCVDEKSGNIEEVAIKFLYSDLPESMIERARREAAIRLHNDNLVEMKGFFEIEDTLPTGKVMKRYHVVSELIRGVMLDDLMHGKTTDQEGHDLPYAKELYKDYMNDPYHFSLFIIKNVLSGLMALHDAGYIHRDIDPTNIMITDDKHVKLIDFGIAKQLIQLSTFDKSLTSSGQFIGKASYAAPELVLGDIKNQNKSTDTYSVGILLFQCIVGHLPFEGTDNEVMGMQMRTNIPANLIKQSALRKIISKATAKKQTQRYQTAAEFRVDLEKIQNLPYPEQGILLKKIGKIAAAAVVAALLVFGVVKLLSNVSFGGGDAETAEVVAPTLDTYDGIVDGLKDETRAKEAFSRLDSLAKKNHADATFLLSRLYFVSKTASDYRPDSIKLMQKNTGVATDYAKAHELLQKTVKLNGHDYHALYELGCDFLGGEDRTEAVERNLQKAHEYFAPALEYAKEAKDEDYVQKITEQIDKYKDFL